MCRFWVVVVVAKLMAEAEAEAEAVAMIGVPWRGVMRVRMGGEMYEGWVNFHSSVVCVRV